MDAHIATQTPLDSFAAICSARPSGSAMTKTEFLQSVEREYFIIKQIHSALKSGDLQFRPSEDQRSTEELLRYLSWCGYESVRKTLSGEEYVESTHKQLAEEFPIEEFAGQIDEQLSLIKRAIERISDDDWQSQVSRYWWGQKGSLPAVLVETTLKWLTAYRMNLFLFAKAAGHLELDRKTCWTVPDDWN